LDKVGGGKHSLFPHLSKGINTSYIALNLKVSCGSSFNDFRPVSLLNGLYKIIAKILATRLKEVM